MKGLSLRVVTGWALIAAALAACSSAPVEESQGTLAPVPPSATATNKAVTTISPRATTIAEADTATRYLALGDSLTAGYQAARGEDKTGGYVGMVLQSWQRRHVGARLTNLACFGDDTTAMQTGTGSSCSYPEGSQLAAALASLRESPGTGLVTITIGVNDIYGCTVVGIDDTCLAYATRTVGTALTSMLAQIRAAAPSAVIVALTYYNPFIATSEGTPDAPVTVAPRVADTQVAADSTQAFTALNRVIASAALAVDGRVADVAGAFAVTDTSGSPLPVNVQRLCDWTALCRMGNAHPNDAGYAAIARAVVSVL